MKLLREAGWRGLREVREVEDASAAFCCAYRTSLYATHLSCSRRSDKLPG